MKKLALIPILFVLSGCEFMMNGGVVGWYIDYIDAKNKQIELEEQEYQQKKQQEEAEAQKNKEIEKAKKEQEEKEYTKKTKILIAKRCRLFGWEKGTSDYVVCNKSRFDVFQTDVYMYHKGSYKKTYDLMVSRYNNDENTCIEYGLKRGTIQFNKCKIELEQLYIHHKQQQLKSEKERLTRKLSNPNYYNVILH
jgi:hypothetical protein